MPTYEYKCDGCKDIFEEHQSIHDKPLVKCKKCGGSLKKIFSPAGIIFKGSGFHVTDYCSPKKTGEQVSGPSSK